MALDSGVLAELHRLYPDLDPGFFQTAEVEFERLHCAGGTELMREGAASDGLYLLVNGRLRASRRRSDGSTQVLGEISRGEMVGEMSLLTEGVRTATVVAIRDSDLLRLSNDTFFGLMQRHPALTRQFYQLLVRRLGRAAPVERVSTVALLQREPGGRTAEGLRALVAALSQADDVAVIDAAAAERALGEGAAGAEPGSPGHARLATWLNEEERRHRLVVYLAQGGTEGAGGAAGAWTRRCLRQADRVLVLADARAGAAPGAFEAMLETAGMSAGLELVLIHPAGDAEPSGTSAWLRLPRLRRHHHLREGSADDLRRMARHLLGRSLGLVLGGGGAKALAHIGLLRALHEAGIAYDIVGGTSMGSTIGALAASGIAPDEIERRMRDALRHKPFSGLTYPALALLNGRRLERAMRGLFGDRSIEDLWLKYFCVSCNLSRLTVDVHQQGPLRHWVRASNAVPGIVPPQLDHGEIHVDGGLLNNLPADAMRAAGASTVLTCNVSAAAPLTSDYDFGSSPSGWNLLLRRRAGAKFPGLRRILMRSVLMASAAHAESMRGASDIYFTPHVAEYDINDWDEADRLIEIGYRDACEAIPGWKLAAA